MYHLEVYKVVDRKDGQHTYCIEISEGFGAKKWVHRSKLRPCEDMGVALTTRPKVKTPPRVLQDDSMDQNLSGDKHFECQDYPRRYEVLNPAPVLPLIRGGVNPPLERPNFGTSKTRT